MSALYREIVSWYFLVDPPAGHAEEAGVYQSTLENAVQPRPQRLLELGSGAGNNALHMKARFTCTLTDLGEEMLALSRAQNPECEHIQGDMRSLRLGKTFDVVLVHDAVMYMHTEEDLRAAALTAFVHTRPGGAALFTPDYTRETFHEGTEEDGNDDETRSLRYLAWVWDPDPSDTTYRVDYSFLLRENGEVRVLHDTHIEGLFSREDWRRILESVGFQVEEVRRVLDDDELEDVMFLARRPADS
jgi:trans-aconitate methyltransferase